MSNTFDLNQKRLEKLIEDNSKAQAAFKQLMQEMQLNHQSFELMQHFSLKALQLETDEDLVMLLDDFFQGELRVHWHMHIPQNRIKPNFDHRLSTYSDAIARKQLSHTVVDKQFEYTELPEQTMLWLMGQTIDADKIKVLPFDAVLNHGFLVLGINSQSIEISAQAYGFLSQATKTLVEKLIRDYN